MFRDGQYLEVIKASDNCLATAVVTVQERIIKLKRKRISTNKWLDLEDWVAVYKILERAILRNVRKEGLFQNSDKCRGKKSTRQLDITVYIDGTLVEYGKHEYGLRTSTHYQPVPLRYTFEQSEITKDVASLPTIRVNVSPAKKRSGKLDVSGTSAEKEEIGDRTLEKSGSCARSFANEKHNNDTLPKKAKNHDVVTKLTNDKTKNIKTKRYLQLEGSKSNSLEEYVPDAPAAKKLCTNLKYIPSRKSTLERIQISSNEYSPTILDNKSTTEDVRYIPNSIDTSKVLYETYEPSAATIVDLPEEYVPTSKGTKASVEEYQPDFTSKSMKFDNSYVPSSVQQINENSRKTDRPRKHHLEKHLSRQKEISKKHMDLFTYKNIL